MSPPVLTSAPAGEERRNESGPPMSPFGSVVAHKSEIAPCPALLELRLPRNYTTWWDATHASLVAPVVLDERSRPEKWCIDHRVIRPQSYAVSDAGRAFSVPWSASGNRTGRTLARASRLM